MHLLSYDDVKKANEVDEKRWRDLRRKILEDKKNNVDVDDEEYRFLVRWNEKRDSRVKHDLILLIVTLIGLLAMAVYVFSWMVEK